MKTKKIFMFKAFMLIAALLFAGSISACSKGGGSAGAASSGGGAQSDGGRESGDSGGGGSGYISVANTSGRLTISGLNKYNGQWVYIALASIEDDLVLLAADSVTSSVLTCAKITNGSATLKAWKQTKVNDNSSRLENYSGSDKGFGGGAMILNKATITYAEAESGASLLSGGNTPNWMTGIEIILGVNFANGKADCTPIDLNNLFDGINW
jgi:hypothetical protein